MELKVNLDTYTSVDESVDSDHKPVIALCSLQATITLYTLSLICLSVCLSVCHKSLDTYTSVDESVDSDHKPVIALCSLQATITFYTLSLICLSVCLSVCLSQVIGHIHKC